MRDLKIYLFIATGLLVFYIIAQMNRPKPVKWDETLNDNDKIPFGTYILHHQITDIFKGSQVFDFREPVYNVVSDHDFKNASYIIVAPEVSLQNEDVDKLIKFVNKGNDVFICASLFSEKMSKKLHIKIGYENSDSTAFEQSKKVDTRLLNPSLDTSYAYTFDKEICSNYFNEFDTTKAIILGRNNYGHSNFIKYPMGKGALYLNANPLLFSNYALLKKQGSDYASYALSYIKKTDNVLWDEFYTQGRSGENNSMRVFLRHEPLKWAFRITLFTLILFILFEIKRRQRIIPIIVTPANSTVDFVSVVGRVYYEQRNNANIAQKKILYFLEHLRTAYYLKTNVLDGDFIEKLSQKTGVDITFVQELVAHMQYLTDQRVSDRDLIKLNQLIEQFYIKSR